MSPLSPGRVDMKHINRTGRSAANLVEQRKPRRMLSAAVSHHTLVIDGTARADTIVLTMASPRTLTVRVGDVETNVPRKSFGKIRITAGRGDDLVTVGSDANPINAPVSVSGG